MLYPPGLLISRLSFMGRRKLGIFFRGRPIELMLCLDSILLTQLNVALM
jgi:hypothetical protein